MPSHMLEEDASLGDGSLRTWWTHSLKVMQVGGVPVRLHGTFLAMIPVALGYGWLRGEWVGLMLTAKVLAVMPVLVLMHELAHVFTARAFGAVTRSVTLSPIGGVAMIELQSMAPWQDVLVSLAGPASNLALAALLWGTEGELRILMFANLLLGLFNLLPAYPMDGGRVLRSSLRMVVPEEAAASMSLGVGVLVVGAMLAVGLALGQVGLVLVGVFLLVVQGMEMRALGRG